MEQIVSSESKSWTLAAGGVVVGSWILSHGYLPAFLGVYTNLVVGVALMVLALKLIKNKEGAAFTFGLGFAIGLDGLVRMLMPSTQTATVAWNYV